MFKKLMCWFPRHRWSGLILVLAVVSTLLPHHQFAASTSVGAALLLGVVQAFPALSVVARGKGRRFPSFQPHRQSRPAVPSIRIGACSPGGPLFLSLPLPLLRSMESLCSPPPPPPNGG